MRVRKRLHFAFMDLRSVPKLKPTNHGGIYEIVNLVNERRYVGQAANFNVRWSQHRNLLRAGKHHCAHLQRAWNKYGEREFVFRVLEIVENPTRERLKEREQWWFDSLSDRYNTAPVAGSRRGVPQSASAIAKVAAANRKAWADPERRAKRMASMAAIDQIALQAKRRATVAERYPDGIKLSTAHRARLVETNRARKGIPTNRVFSPETRAKIGVAHRARYASGERIMRGEDHPMFGRKHSEYTRALQSIAKKGKPSPKRPDVTRCAKGLHAWVDGQRECRACANVAGSASRLRRLGRTQKITGTERMTPEVCAKISAKLTGRVIGPPSEEHRRKLSESQRGKIITDEMKANMRAGQRARFSRPNPPSAKSTTGMRGLGWDKSRNRWMVQITRDGAKISRRFKERADAEAFLASFAISKV